MSPFAPSSLGPKRVLIIEDDRETNASLQRAFQTAGCEVDGCFDGAQGLERLQNSRYDAVLLDLLMPVQDGFAVLAKKPGTINAPTPAYVLTTLDGEQCQLALELGAKTAFIKSRTSPAEVAEAVCRDLGTEQPR
jgi:two-component system copper resistance phosphate regulon response regulator CusR